MNTRPVAMIRITPYTPPAVSANVKLCGECRHARRLQNVYKNDIGCALFRNIDVVGGVPVYDLALDARRDENACGMAGRFHEPYGHRAPASRPVPPAPSPSSAYNSVEETKTTAAAPTESRLEVPHEPCSSDSCTDGVMI